LCLNNIGLVYKNQNKLEEAKSFLEKALQLIKDTIGETKHTFISSCLMNLGLVYSNMKDFKTAEEKIKQAFDLRKDDFKLEKADILYNLGCIRHNIPNKSSEADNNLKEAEEIRKKILGERSFDVASIYYNNGLMALK